MSALKKGQHKSKKQAFGTSLIDRIVCCRSDCLLSSKQDRFWDWGIATTFLIHKCSVGFSIGHFHCHFQNHSANICSKHMSDQNTNEWSKYQWAIKIPMSNQNTNRCSPTRFIIPTAKNTNKKNDQNTILLVLWSLVFWTLVFWYWPDTLYPNLWSGTKWTFTGFSDEHPSKLWVIYDRVQI